MNRVLRPIFQQTVGALSGHRANNKLLVLTYHRVLADYDPVIDEVDSVQFTRQMETLAEYFNVVSLESGLEQMRQGTLPAGSVCVTFDDGYRDNYDVALPILSALNLHATFFIATGYLGDGVMWNDVVRQTIKYTSFRELDLHEFSLGKVSINTELKKLQLIEKLLGYIKYNSVSRRIELVDRLRQLAEVELSERLMMTEDEVKALSNAGMEIGGHTVNHPIMTCADEDEVRQEIVEGKLYLENILNKKLKFFAYPNGQADKDYDERHMQFVEEAGFNAALTTNNGVIDKSMGMFDLPRISIDHTSKFKFGVSLARGYVQYAN
ncbi:MAG: polysaccharide deacetylase family protein [Gammaproteobacteria bacterium]|nr:polysaccharide deacetylase family protein [Gammaproteobacteria bacterium]